MKELSVGLLKLAMHLTAVAETLAEEGDDIIESLKTKEEAKKLIRAIEIAQQNITITLANIMLLATERYTQFNEMEKENDTITAERKRDGEPPN